MSFSYHDDALHAEHVPLSVIADAVDTPVYVYSTAAIRAAWCGGAWRAIA